MGPGAPGPSGGGWGTRREKGTRDGRGLWRSDRVPRVDPTRTEAPAPRLYRAVQTADLRGGQGARANLWRGSFFRQVLKLDSGYCGEGTWRHQRGDRSGHALEGRESSAARLMIFDNVAPGSSSLLSPGVFNWRKAPLRRKTEFRLSMSPAWRRRPLQRK